MKLVIDIPEHAFEECKNIHKLADVYDYAIEQLKQQIENDNYFEPSEKDMDEQLLHSYQENKEQLIDLIKNSDYYKNYQKDMNDFEEELKKAIDESVDDIKPIEEY